MASVKHNKQKIPLLFLRQQTAFLMKNFLNLLLCKIFPCIFLSIASLQTQFERTKHYIEIVSTLPDGKTYTDEKLIDQHKTHKRKLKKKRFLSLLKEG